MSDTTNISTLTDISSFKIAENEREVVYRFPVGTEIEFNRESLLAMFKDVVWTQEAGRSFYTIRCIKKNRND